MVVVVTFFTSMACAGRAGKVVLIPVIRGSQDLIADCIEDHLAAANSARERDSCR